MNIKRFINQNSKKIWKIIGIIAFVLFLIKSLNSYYEEKEQKEKIEVSENAVNNTEIFIPKDYGTQNDTIKETIGSFIYYCNNKDSRNAYKMLTTECKNAMFPTVEDFEKIYINNIYNIERTYDLVKWSTEGNMETYLVTLLGDLLSTGGKTNSTQEYYTFVKDNKGMYKLNINNYIYGKNRNLKSTVQGITIEIGHVDVYEDHETVEITITNNTSNTICLTGNKYNKNIYLKNSSGITYSSLNSKFDNKEIVMKPKSIETFLVDFNKSYNSINKAQYLVLSDVIFDYEEYLQYYNKEDYTNRTNIEVQY